MFGAIKKLLKTMPLINRISVTSNTDRSSSYPANGLTPNRLAQIFREADTGDILRQTELFEQMEERDPHIYSQLQTRKNAVIGLDYEVISVSDNYIDNEVAEFAQKQLKSIDNLEEIFLDLLDAIGKGISFVEIIWGVKDGKIIIKKLKEVSQQNFYWDNNDMLRLRTNDNPMGILIPKDKFIIHMYKAKSGHPSRAGVLRVVSWMYLFKNYDIKDWVNFCETYGMPMRFGKYDHSTSEEDRKALMNALINLGTDAVGVFPIGTEIDIKESNKKSSSEIYEKLARFCDEQISKCIVGQTLTSDSNGSYAQSKTHNEVRHDLVVADCKALERTIKRDLITPLVRFNFGSNVEVPTIRFDCKEAEDLMQMANVYKILINDMKLPIGLSHLYQKFNIPVPSNEESIAKSQEESNSVNNIKPVVNKSAMKNIDENKSKINELIDVSTSKSIDELKKSFNVIENKLVSVKSLEELKSIFEDENQVYEMLKEMRNSKLENLIHNSWIISYFIGRLQTDE